MHCLLGPNNILIRFLQRRGGLVGRADDGAGERPALKVEKVTTRAGGKKIRLDDRFTMEMTATTAPDGKAAVTCTEAPRPPAAGSEEHRHDR